MGLLQSVCRHQGRARNKNQQHGWSQIRGTALLLLGQSVSLQCFACFWNCLLLSIRRSMYVGRCSAELLLCVFQDVGWIHIPWDPVKCQWCEYSLGMILSLLLQLLNEINSKILLGINEEINQRAYFTLIAGGEDREQKTIPHPAKVHYSWWCRWWVISQSRFN